jgi:hypothetical protein
MAALLPPLALLCGCDNPQKAPAATSDPLAVLGDPESGPRAVAAAMDTLDSDPTRKEYVQALRKMLHQPGWPMATREKAFERLERNDPDALKRTLELQLPRMDALEWRRKLCQMIAQRGWVDMAPTLVRAWAEPRPGWVERDEERPERQALEQLVGKDKVPDYLFQTLLEADAVSAQNLRTRCWEILVRLGQRERLEALLRDASLKPNDLFLADLRAGALELGLFPANREEILWVRKLREPSRKAFWQDAAVAVQRLPDARRRTLEIRDIPVVVAAQRHRPALVAATDDELYSGLEAWLRSPVSKPEKTIDFEGWSGEFRQRLREWRPDLTWGDLLAMSLAVEALQVPQVRAHLFDYADRDVRDKTTEYGGVIRLDDQGRYEVVEFPPRVRGNDERFEAPQELLDAGYTALFHFHFHATKHENERYAAPAQGDFMYANNTRANALTFTFIKKDLLNVDYYRHGGVSVDLGSIRRP